MNHDEEICREWENGKPLLKGEISKKREALTRSEMVCLVISVAFLFFLAVAPTWAEQLCLGWLLFPVRVLPQISPDSTTILFGIASFIILVVGTRFMLIWWWRSRSKPSHDMTKSELNGRSAGRMSLSLVGGLMLVFVAGTAMIGIVHQITWLIRGRMGNESLNRVDEQEIYGPFLSVLKLSDESARKIPLRDMRLGFFGFHEEHGRFPPGGLMNEKGRLLHGWAMMIGPYTPFFANQLDYKVPWNQPPNDRFYRCGLNVFTNSSVGRFFDSEGYGLSHYSANAYLFPIREVSTKHEVKDWSVFQKKGNEKEKVGLTETGWSLSEITDGQETTLLVGEAAGNYKPWGHPSNVRDPGLGVGRSLDGFGGPPGSNGAYFLMASGVVRFISNKTDPQIVKAYGTPNGGEKVNPLLER